MLTVASLWLLVLFVAYANGANDNFKGVATLLGSRVAGYRTSMLLALVTTFAGSLSAVLLGQALIRTFTGNGLVSDATAADPTFMRAVAVGCGATVMLATVRGLPVSTTHALVGALAGAGWATSSDIRFSALGTAFLLPLLLSPLLSALLALTLYRVLHQFGQRAGVVKQSCICVEPGRFVPVRQFAIAASPVSIQPPSSAVITIDNYAQCVEKYSGHILGFTVQRFLDVLHYASACAVCFARGLSDTPKIVALLLVGGAIGTDIGVLVVGTMMAIGGMVSAKHVALTLSKRISHMNDGQALTANVVTSLLVIVTSRYGLPVSTTHVIVGAIGGVGFANHSVQLSTVKKILGSWIVTLPTAAVIAASVRYLLSGV